MRDKANLVIAAEEVEKYLRTIKNVENMQGPEYGIWHRLKSALDDFHRRHLMICSAEVCIDSSFLDDTETDCHVHGRIGGVDGDCPRC